MSSRTKSRLLIICLFVFLFIVLGSELRLSPMGALAAAASATPLVVFLAKRWQDLLLARDARKTSDAADLPTTSRRSSNSNSGESGRKDSRELVQHAELKPG
jgi:hypothetical protein